MRILVTLLAWLAVLPIVAWTAVRLSGGERGFPVVALIAYTPYVAAGALLVAFALLVIRRRLPALVAALAAVALLSSVAARAVPEREATADGPRLRILSANVGDSPVAARVLTRMVRDHRVDVLSVQELTPELYGRLRRGPAGRLLPHGAVRPADGARGTGLLSRRPLALRPLLRGQKNRTAVARMRWPGFGAFEIVAVHPPPPTPSQLDGWAEDLRGLPRADAGRLPRVLAGDFNATLDHEELRMILASGYRDAAASAGEGLTGTWPSDRRLPPPVAIDHILVPTAWRVAGARVLELPGSDHRAVLAELAPPERLLKRPVSKSAGREGERDELSASHLSRR